MERQEVADQIIALVKESMARKETDAGRKIEESTATVLSGSKADPATAESDEEVLQYIDQSELDAIREGNCIMVDSLDVTELTMEMEEKLGLSNIPGEDMQRFTSIRKMVDYVHRKLEEGASTKASS